MNYQEITLRDQLAIDRTKLANQRTLLAMLRTGMYLIILSATILSLPVLVDLRWLSIITLIGGILTGCTGFVFWNIQKNKINNTYLKS